VQAQLHGCLEVIDGCGAESRTFAQHRVDQLRLNASPVEHLWRLAPDHSEQELHDADLAETNLLLLDEPTNHLDLGK